MSSSQQCLWVCARILRRTSDALVPFATPVTMIFRVCQCDTFKWDANVTDANILDLSSQKWFAWNGSTIRLDYVTTYDCLVCLYPLHALVERTDGRMVSFQERG